MSGNVETTCHAVHAGFFERAAANPASIALDFGDQVCSYGDLRTLSLGIADAVGTCGAAGAASPWVGMLAGKSLHGYAAMLGILAASKGYMPLSCLAPGARVADMIERSGTSLLFVDEEGVRALPSVLARINRRLTVLVGMADENAAAQVETLEKAWPSHAFRRVAPAAMDCQSPALEVRRDMPVYLLFTSGSTGRPKGVMVSHGNVRHFLDAMADRYSFTATDRFSQNFDFTFDLSVFDVFACLGAGGCICVPSGGDRVLPARYINRSRLTVWFSVPSAVTAMQATRQLKPGAFGGLRYSFFCGEALIVKAARAWQAAAPPGKLVNLYGPTEATICCTEYAWSTKDRSLADEHIVPIGSAFPGLHASVRDESGLAVAGEEIGELCIGGPQVALGYLDSPEENEKRFVEDTSSGQRLYRTGDRVFLDARGCLHFVGRVDHQVKVKGYRIELGEVEQALRACSVDANAVAVPWPPQGPHERLVAVCDVGGRAEREGQRLIGELRQRLPDYMLPDEVVFMDRFPLNGNGKIDRRAVTQALADRLTGLRVGAPRGGNA
ncbi:amino acid adenylation domain-containing protein [Burkholderia sp. AU45388]|uniref:amino acid adenylation domain-containing protein n=1 Tax=Burkholderia sp. AU45388 TaxID=3059206 RepID=UPI00265416E8|nr:amino acid adenylation domain-containing protein [Burkholderia sp. AU45388]MDN7428166.1 amino acid adenylation domain-containing protein [Burkholderia sp. AU45388]